MPERLYTAIGLMSGTSADGVDAALIKTDGETIVEHTAHVVQHPYPAVMRARILDAMKGQGDILALEKDVTDYHAEAVKMLTDKADMPLSAVDVIGFHGQTLVHRPKERLTWQIGNGAQLAYETGCDVVCDFRRADVAAGGEGAPLVPVYHAALAGSCEKPVAFLNIGGVSNITWIGNDGRLLAFDCGPGNAFIDEWVESHTGQPFDAHGEIAASGHVDEALVVRWMEHPYFSSQPPKSLDRYSFSVSEDLKGMSLADGAATLAAFTARAVSAAVEHLPQMPVHWYVCGGGRHNSTLMHLLAEVLPGAVEPVDNLGINGDMVEAQAFAYLAVRRLRGLPITFPATTRVPQPMVGGAVYLASPF